MNSPHDGSGLAVLQARFAAVLGARPASEDDRRALTECIVDDGIEPAARAQVYRNNGRAQFEGALARTYPVLRRRVGEARFAALAHRYRTEHPSRSGDLHWVGARFPAWLAANLDEDDEPGLVDVARLEWACEESLVAAQLPRAMPEALAATNADRLPGCVLGLQPGIRCVSSPFPIWSAWREDQVTECGAPLDASSGPEHVVVACGGDGLVLHRVPEAQCRFVSALAAGHALEDAIDASGLEITQLPGVLAWLFGEGLVTGVRESARGDAA